MNNARGFFRPRIGSITLSVLVSVYLVALTNRTFWSKIHTYLADYPAAIWTLYLAMGVLFVAFLTAFSVKYVAKPFFVLLIVAAAIGSWFTDTFGVIIDSDMVRNAFQTTPAEAQHLITPGFIVHMFVFAMLPVALLLWVRVDHRPIFQTVARNTAVVLACLVVFAGSGFAFSKPYVTAIRQHKDIVKSLNPVTPLAGTIKFLMQATEDANVVVQPLGMDAKIVRTSAGTGKPRVTIIVAGETARAANFSLGGYGRMTNPELAQQDIVYFPNTTSCGTATATSIPCMFSMFTRSEYSHRKGLENENLVDVLAHAGVNVEWWENNTGSKGVADRIPHTDFVKIDDPQFCTNGECRDDIFFDRLDAWLDGVKKDSVLVLHTMGSHGPTYHLRYPEAFRRFTPDCQTAELGDCTDAEIVNAYDNSILFTDHVLSTVIDKLKARSSKFETGMIYMSDHGESLGEHGLYLHGTPYILAPEFQTHIPFIVWMDAAFANSMKMDRACLNQKAAQDYSHDNMFHSVLDMMNIQTNVYNPALDVFAACKTGASS
ncbi:MAG: phosphoethanolamine transferase [Rhizobiales bacterium 63-7]|uniref:phosphoethanolamine transferase n=1 Tax=Rhizobiaceae TaxID=82115 RepID=UPI0009283661|nr:MULTISPECIES: phosphoethanolamine--lipid A transferase [Rhizobiaceae]MBN9034190.1 phosphoethanolamine--lipid A transferase [Hyphomicrobiales bacterium]OJU66434.1 MAG: phosphoethanolamine transferase [Rhizobiales bacterium 63-7]WKL23553.1 phosphoethanolamine--lipid A transferase [Agrobacterium tumefaciens]MBN9052850.1 phosphoethanolamine--lipid A transferase [Hyphomicrobiales bacterium]MDG3580312.1 phosphoethanolamine--lipid A transferase [Rhizobium sp. YJ-22]